MSKIIYAIICHVSGVNNMYLWVRLLFKNGVKHQFLLRRLFTFQDACALRSLPVFPSRSVVKMAEQKSVPSDLYKCVYSFLLENKFTKAAQLFLKQTKVVSIWSWMVVRQLLALSAFCCVRRGRVAFKERGAQVQLARVAAPARLAVSEQVVLVCYIKN